MHFFLVATFFVLSISTSYQSQCSDSASDTSCDSNEWDFMTEIAPLIGQELTQRHDHKSPEPEKGHVIELSEISTQEKISTDTEQNLRCPFPQRSPGAIAKKPHHNSIGVMHTNYDLLNSHKNTINQPLPTTTDKKEENPYKARKKYIVKNNTSWICTIKTCLQCLCCLQDDAYLDEEEKKE